MKDAAIRFILVGILGLAVCGGVWAGETSTDEAESGAQTPRVVTYFANYPHDPTLGPNLAMLMDASRKGYLTHVILGLFHCEWEDRPQRSGPCVSLNGLYPNDPRLQPLWEAVKFLQAHGIKVLASFGGGGVGDYHHLLDPAQPQWYPQLRAALKDHGMDGLDLDIEESAAVVTTKNVRALLKKLRKDFGDDFLITSAPVASALLPGGDSVSPNVNYRKLLKEGWFNWYNLQFYNGFGDLLGQPYGEPRYEDVLKANRGITPRRFVAGVPTAPTAAEANYHAISALAPKLHELAEKVPRFGGVYGWIFSEAVVKGKNDPVGWVRGVSEALRPEPRSHEGGGGASAVEKKSGEVSSPRYAFQYLGTGGGIATAINEGGDAVGWSLIDGEGYRAFLHRGGHLENLGTLPNGKESQALGIDAGGRIVGWALDEHFDVRPFLTVSGGIPRDLGTLGGRQGAAWDVDDAGGVVGWSTTAGGIPRAFLTGGIGPADEMDDLGSLGGASSQALAVDESGRICGWAQTPDGSWQAFFRNHGQDVVPVPFPYPLAASQATDVRASGVAVHIAGWGMTAVGFDAFSYTMETFPQRPDFFGTRIGAQAGATGIDSTGRVVGWYIDGNGASRAFLKDPGGEAPLDLSDLVVDLPPGETLTIATAINDSGLIVGQTLSGRPFLLTPKVRETK